MRRIENVESSKMAPFYMVWVDGNSMPIKKHNTAIEASAEAYRLCEKEHCDAYVLKVIGGYEYCTGIADVEVMSTDFAVEE